MRVSLTNSGNGMTNEEVIEYSKKLKLPNFKYYMRDEMRKSSPFNLECGVINLNTSKQNGSHHSCYWIDGDNKYYFDSFGVIPPKELVNYLKRPILYSTYQIQQYNDTNCSEWCLYVLNELNKGDDFINVILNIIEKHKIY